MPPATTTSRPDDGPTRGGPHAARRPATRAVVLLAVVAVALVAGPGPAGAQTDPADPGQTTTTTVPAAPDTTPPPAAASPGPTTTTTVPTSALIQLDVASIDALLAEARAQAQRLRDVQIATAAEGVRSAEARVSEAIGRLAEASARRDEMAAEVTARETEVETVRRRIGLIAADAFMRVGTDRDDEVARLRLGDGSEDSAAVDAQQTAVYAGGAVEATRADLRAARGRLSGARAALRDAEAVADARRQEVDGLESVADAARSVESALRSAPLDVPAAATVSSLYGDVGPSILGSSLLSAEDLAAFSKGRGSVHPTVDLDALATAFIDEGTAEGVRADIAWAQSIIETGNFGFAGSMVLPGDHNYAGIGACDSCTRGFVYDTPQLGARAQMQLLRTYADDTITSATLARPPVGRPPEKVGVRGCCATWMALSGVWATGPGYGVKILTLYNEMLRFAVQRRLAGPAGPAAVAPTTAPTVPQPGTTVTAPTG